LSAAVPDVRVTSKSTDVARNARKAERRLTWTVRVGTWVIRLLARTWRFHVINAEGYLALRHARQAFVFSLWHGDMLPLLYSHRHEGVAVLISEHRDGELIARIVERFGFRTVRGSTSRNAGRALIGLVKALEDGLEIAVTPDGPRGPIHSYAPGAVIAAHRASTSIIPIGVAASRSWRLRSWDRFLIPKPFSRVTIAYGDPVRPRGNTTREAAADAEHFAQLMAEAERRASSAPR
jgi:lysophospholipid acyltransferase (LPLAT)-like uncharacterized protein